MEVTLSELPQGIWHIVVGGGQLCPVALRGTEQRGGHRDPDKDQEVHTGEPLS